MDGGAYRVVIPCAGTGSRMGALCEDLPKALLAVAHRPVLAHIIDKFDPSVTVVLALGHKGDLIRQFVTLAYPDRTFTFVEVNLYEGAGSGLGYSLLCCREHLQMPFVFCSCDTIVEEEIPKPDENWVGFDGAISAGNAYRSVLACNGRLIQIMEKGENKDMPALIGLCGIRDYEAFWRHMASPRAVAQGEAFGLNGILPLGVRVRDFTWHDTGTPESLDLANKAMDDGGPTILPKPNERIWFVNGRVIKWSTDRGFIANRVKRAEILRPCVPKLCGSTENMYAYPMAKGRVLSEVITPDLTVDLLNWLQQVLWYRVDADPTVFLQQCHRFYREKTLRRVRDYLDTKPQFGNPFGGPRTQIINGASVQGIDTLLSRVPWEVLSNGVPVRWHGDLHFENILHDDDTDNFVLLDWRQDFEGELNYGDLYYDLAKLLHGMIVCHTLIAKNLYWCDSKRGGSVVDFELLRRHVLVECERAFWRWVEKAGLDRFHVELLTALIFLNIAPLHHAPYGDLLFHLGKSMLDAVLDGAGR